MTSVDLRNDMAVFAVFAKRLEILLDLFDAIQQHGAIILSKLVFV